MNIGSKLILSFLLVTLVPTVLLAIFTTRIISDSKRNDFDEAIRHNLGAAWAQYYSRAHQLQFGMLHVSHEPSVMAAVASRDGARLAGLVAFWRKYAPSIDMWAVVDENSKVITNPGGRLAGTRLPLNGLVDRVVRSGSPLIANELVPESILKAAGLAEAAYVPRAAQGVNGADERAASKAAPPGVEAGAVKDGLMLLMLTPVSDPSGRVRGVIVSGNLLNNDTFFPDSFAGVLPDSLVAIAVGGVHVASTAVGGKEARLAGLPVPREAEEAIRGNHGFSGEVMMGSAHYIGVFDPIVGYSGDNIGSLFVGFPREKFFALAQVNMKAIVTIALIGVVIAAGVGFFITYMITRPILLLKRRAQQVSSGNLVAVRTGVWPRKGDDEISDLTMTFDRMVRNLSENEKKITSGREQLSRQKNLIESIINSLPYCLYVMDREMRIAVWNRHAATPCAICGAAPEEDCSGADFLKRLPPSGSRDELGDVIRSVFASGRPRSLDCRLTVGAGSEMKHLDVLMSVFPIFSSRLDAVEHVVWMAEDVTRKRAMEASVISTEKLAALGTLAAGMAHEVNNPLGGILNCIYNLRSGKLGEQRRAEYLDSMEDGMKRVQNIVRQLLDFSQQHAPERTLTDINAMIQGVIPLFLHYIRDRDTRLVQKLGGGLPSILVDKHQIEQILVNLVLNALQAVDGGGVVEISTRYEGQWFLITVADNGCGIPPEIQPRIFDPFFTTKGVGKGTGLGLSVSRGIIERHNGRIEVESRVGEGTVFKVFLPIAA